MNINALALCLLPLGLLFAGCNSNSYRIGNHLPKTKQMVVSNVTVDEAVQGRPSVGSPIAIDKQRVVMLPFALEHQKRWFEDSDHFREKRSGGSMVTGSAYSYGGSGGSHGYGTRWHNVIFKHLDTGKEWLLLQQRGVITQYKLAGPREKVDDEWDFTPKLLMFSVTNADTDKDGSLTSNDATSLVIADPDGSNIRQVTASGMNCANYRWDEETGLVYLKMVRDSNGDGVFTALDESAPYQFDPDGTASKAVPMVTPAIQSKARGLLQ